MRTQGRLVLLSLRLIRRSAGKYLTIVVLLTVCVLVFLSVQAIAAASADSLDDSITGELGQTGSFRVEIADGLGISADRLDAAVVAAVSGVNRRPVGKAVRLDGVPWTCKADAETTGQPLYLVFDDVRAEARPIRGDVRAGVACMAGLDVSSFVSPAAGLDRQFLGEAALIDPQVFGAASVLSPRAPTSAYLVVTGRYVDDSAAILGMLTQALRVDADKAGVGVDDLGAVTRLDQGSETRAAAGSVRLVYGLVAWAILLVGAVGLLLVETANTRERSWLFGLARAVGATRASIALLVFIDAALIVLAGAMLTAVAGALLAPAVSDFGRDTFETSLVLLDPAVVPELVVGIVVVLAVGAALPARRAATQDPVDVLERR